MDSGRPPFSLALLRLVPPISSQHPALCRGRASVGAKWRGVDRRRQFWDFGEADRINTVAFALEPEDVAHAD